MHAYILADTALLCAPCCLLFSRSASCYLLFLLFSSACHCLLYIVLTMQVITVVIAPSTIHAMPSTALLNYNVVALHVIYCSHLSKIAQFTFFLMLNSLFVNLNAGLRNSRKCRCIFIAR